MNDLRTAAQQALEALGLAKLNGKAGLHPAEIGEIADAITALRAVLAQQAELQPMPPEQRQRWEELAAMPQQAEPVEPVAWKQGNLVTFNEDPCPVLGGLFVQFWDGEEVAARVYANDLKTLRQRCAKVNTAPPQRTMVPLTEEEIDKIFKHLCDTVGASCKTNARAVEKAVWEKNHGQA